MLELKNVKRYDVLEETRLLVFMDCEDFFETSTRAVSTMVSKKKAFADVVHAYTYTFDGTNVAFEPEKDGIWAKLNGYISGDNMTVTNLSTKGVTVYKRVK